MKIYTNELGHMTTMAAMPIYGKNIKKSSSPEPINWWPWNIVCSIVYESTTKIVQIMTLGWPWPILCQGQIWSHRLLYGKKWKLFIFLETILALGLKVIWSIQLNELMKLSEYQRSRSFFYTQISKLKLVFLKNSWAIWNQSSYESLRENGNENLYKWVGSHDHHGRHAHIW